MSQFANDLKSPMSDIAVLINQIAALLNKTPEQVEREVAARKAARANRNAKFHDALDRCTDIQQLVIEKLVQGGARPPKKLMENRRTGNVAVMLTKFEVWNGAKGRVMPKLMVVYPDGSRTETFEKSISIKKEF